jgi:hypothetical protein
MFDLSSPPKAETGVANKKPSSADSYRHLKRVQLVFTIPEHNPIRGKGFPQIILCPKSPPAAETCQLTNLNVVRELLF